MAGLGEVTVGIKMKDPNWQLLCVGLASDSMEALANLENGNAKRAMEILTHSRGKVHMAFMCEHSERKPKDVCDHEKKCW